MLFRTILDKALVDSFSPHEEVSGDVDDWLDLDNEDFVFICHQADLEPIGVYAAFTMFKKILRGNNARFRQFKRNPDNQEST